MFKQRLERYISNGDLNSVKKLVKGKTRIGWIHTIPKSNKMLNILREAGGDGDLMLYLAKLDLKESLDDLRQIVGDKKFTFKLFFDTLLYLNRKYRKRLKESKEADHDLHVFRLDSGFYEIHYSADEYANIDDEMSENAYRCDERVDRIERRMARIIDYIKAHFESKFSFQY